MVKRPILMGSAASKVLVICAAPLSSAMAVVNSLKVEPIS